MLLECILQQELSFGQSLKPPRPESMLSTIAIYFARCVRPPSPPLNLGALSRDRVRGDAAHCDRDSRGRRGCHLGQKTLRQIRAPDRENKNNSRFVRTLESPPALFSLTAHDSTGGRGGQSFVAGCI